MLLNIFEVAPSITSPIMLTALIILVALFIFRAVIAKTKPVNQKQSNNLLNKIINIFSTLVLLAVAFSFLGYYFGGASGDPVPVTKELPTINKPAEPVVDPDSTKPNTPVAEELSINFDNPKELHTGNWMIKINGQSYNISGKSELSFPKSLADNDNILYELRKNSKVVKNGQLTYDGNQASIVIPKMNNF